MKTLVTGITINAEGNLVRGNYEITDPEKRYVRKVKHAGTIEDFVTPDLDGVTEESAEINTLILAGLLRVKGFSPIVKVKKYKHGKYSVVRCKQFEMYYHSHGFRIHDMNNFHAPVNINEFNNDFCDVETVIEFLRNPPVQATPPKEVDPEVALRKEAVSKLSKKFKVIEAKESPAIAEKSELTEEEIPSAVLKCFEQFKNKDIQTSKELRSTLYDMVPKVYRKFKIQIGRFADEVNRRNFKRVYAEVETFCNEFNFEASIKRPAPKFTGGDLPVGDFESIRINDLEKTVDFVYDGHTINLPRGAFYARYAMSLEPRTMPIFMKFLRGKMTFEQIEEMYFNGDSFIDRDRYCEYEGDRLHTMDGHTDDQLTEIAQYIISALGDYDPKQFVYKGSLYYRHNEDSITLNKKVRVYWPDQNIWDIATVISINKGVKLRYQDGEVLPLLKNQKIKLYYEKD